jgi:long-chain acyl-CoA synthetase
VTDKAALVLASTGESRTYSELDRRGRSLSTRLRELGAEPGGVVAAMVPNGFTFFETVTAAGFGELSFLPVNWHLKHEELAYILNDSGAAVIVADPSLKEHVDAALSAAPNCVALYDFDGEEDGDVEPWTLSNLMFYTSGTTGRPKGVVHFGTDRERMKMAQQGLIALWGYRPDDVHLLAGPAYHAGPSGYAFATLSGGGTVVILESWDPHAALKAIDRHRVTTTFLTPAHFIRLLEVPDEARANYDLSSLRHVIHAGAPCPQAVKERILDVLAPAEIWELYGASEGGATRVSPDEWKARPGTVGLPWPGTEIRILGEDGETVATGTDGVIYIAPPGGGQTFEYHRDADKTSGAWRDNAFTVGDVGHLDGDGYLYITDRIADMVLRDGVNVYPREIEEVLHLHPAVIDCAVVGVPDERHGEILVGVVELREAVEPDDLAAHVRAHVADFKVPGRWEVVDELPRDPNGKVLKRRLREELLSR